MFKKYVKFKIKENYLACEALISLMGFNELQKVYKFEGGYCVK